MSNTEVSSPYNMYQSHLTKPTQLLTHKTHAVLSPANASSQPQGWFVKWGKLNTELIEKQNFCSVGQSDVLAFVFDQSWNGKKLWTFLYADVENGTFWHFLPYKTLWHSWIKTFHFSFSTLTSVFASVAAQHHGSPLTTGHHGRCSLSRELSP